MNLENMLSEISQTQKCRYHMNPLICGTRVVKLTDMESRVEVTRGRKEGVNIS